MGRYDDRPYEVGKGKTPKNRRWVKGQSGNPSGRPKGSKNLASIFLRESRKPIRINGSDGSRMITTAEALVKLMKKEALEGHFRSRHEFLEHTQLAEAALDSEAPEAPSPEMDEKVMQNLLRRMERINAEAKPTKSDGEGEEKK